MIWYTHIQIHTHIPTFFIGSEYALKFENQALESDMIYWIYLEKPIYIFRLFLWKIELLLLHKCLLHLSTQQ